MIGSSTLISILRSGRQPRERIITSYLVVVMMLLGLLTLIPLSPLSLRLMGNQVNLNNSSMVKVLPNYITVEEEQVLLSHFPKRANNKSMDRNSIVRYGSILPYKTKVYPNIPDYFATLLERLKMDEIIESDSITVNEYQERQAISWHVDSLSSGPAIIVLSLLSDAVMGLRYKKDKTVIQDIALPARSLLILDGEERYEWEHSIYPVQSHRYSIVFRKGTDVHV
jgi:alkylated DNA repair dioxygenase AlkB